MSLILGFDPDYASNADKLLPIIGELAISVTHFWQWSTLFFVTKHAMYTHTYHLQIVSSLFWVMIESWEANMGPLGIMWFFQLKDITISLEKYIWPYIYKAGLKCLQYHKKDSICSRFDISYPLLKWLTHLRNKVMNRWKVRAHLVLVSNLRYAFRKVNFFTFKHGL